MLAAAPGATFAIHGTEGSFVKYGMDPQEEALKAGKTPDSPGWDVESTELYGTLTTPGASHAVVRVPTIPSSPANCAAMPTANAQLSASVVRTMPTWPAPLTARQLAVAEAVAEGKSNRQVARELYITVKTVEYHVSQIFAKLGIDDRADIAAAL